jgi:hypothetical protein
MEIKPIAAHVAVFMLHRLYGKTLPDVGIRAGVPCNTLDERWHFSSAHVEQ